MALRVQPQVAEDLLDHGRLQDGGDDLEFSGAAVRAVMHVEIDHALEQPRPADASCWYGLYGPAKMPADLVRRFNDATRRALQQPELQKVWAEQGYVPWSGSPETLASRAAQDREMWDMVTKRITVD